MKSRLRCRMVAEQAYPAGFQFRKLLLRGSRNLLSSTVAAKINQAPVDLSYRCADRRRPYPSSIFSRRRVWRSSGTAYPMSWHRLFRIPFEGVQVSIGPSIEEGFYYDFEYAETFTPEDLEKIEKRMHEIAAANYPFERQEMSRKRPLPCSRTRVNPTKSNF